MARTNFHTQNITSKISNSLKCSIVENQCFVNQIERKKMKQKHFFCILLNTNKFGKDFSFGDGSCSKTIVANGLKMCVCKGKPSPSGPFQMNRVVNTHEIHIATQHRSPLSFALDLISFHCLFNVSSSSSFSITENHLTWKWCTFHALCVFNIRHCSLVSCVCVCLSVLMIGNSVKCVFIRSFMCACVSVAFNNAKIYKQSDEKRTAL